MHTSTSPQSSMIASLDVARKQAGDGRLQAAVARPLALSRELRAQINSTGVFRVLDSTSSSRGGQAGHILLDPTKVTVDISSCGYTVEDCSGSSSTATTSRSRNSTFIR